SLAALALPALFVTQWLLALFKNYRIAKKSGLPILVTPFNPGSFVFLVASRFLRPLLEKVLPFDGIKASFPAWSYTGRKDSLFQRYANIFVLVTPGRNQVWCADPAINQIVLTRRKDFLQSKTVATLFRVLGDNVFTSNHEAWARQRRLVAPKLNERISEVVWKDSTSLADQMAEYMLRQPDSSSRNAISSLRSIAINILGHVGYGQSKPFTASELPSDPKAKMSYADAIALLSQFLLFSAVFPSWFLRLPFMPPIIQTVGTAKAQAPSLQEDMLEAERKRAASGVEERDNMMSMLARFSGPDQPKEGSETAQLLNGDEISGNLFIFTAAGFDTTANTMSYAIAFMAAYPQWQAWVQEEIDLVWKGLEGDARDKPDYAAVFPQLPRMMAVLYETLRIFPATMAISRITDRSQSITSGDKTYYLEGPHEVHLASYRLHYDEATWGSDYLEFRPTRWFESGSALGDSHLVTPAKGTYTPWGGGPRVCPGMRMAQVEFVSVMTTLLRKCRVEPVVQSGETLEDARKRLLQTTEDSSQKISMGMNNPEEVHLKWHQR
ncbi:cytochrome P450, partial [Thozetella sp. PMI_491]